MSHRKPTKLQFIDLWRDEASCNFIVKEDTSMSTAWDNIDVGTWRRTHTIPDANSTIAEQICEDCPVREMCLRDAIQDTEAEGIRGGYRFESGTVHKNVAREIFNKWGLRARVSKRPQILGVPIVQSEEVQELWKNDDD